MYALVLTVTDVNAAMTKSLPPFLMLNVSGAVPTTGWKNPELVPAVYFVEPEDGIWDFHFMAASPDGIVNPLVSSISTNLTVKLPRWCHGVRIHASTNTVEQLLFSGDNNTEGRVVDVESCALGTDRDQVQLKGPGDAWPWLLSTSAIQITETIRTDILARPENNNRNQLKVDSLIGKSLRVVQKGGMITDDYNPNRVTFLLDEHGKIENWLPF